jgi:hypothetical protein
VNRSRATTPSTLLLRGWTEEGELRVVVTEISGAEPMLGADTPPPKLVTSLAALSTEVARWAEALGTRRPSH